MRIKLLQGTWDKREGRGKYIGDQTYIQLEIDTKLQNIRNSNDFRVPHQCEGGQFDFWVHQYPDENLISFVHHNSQVLDSCDYKPIGHKDHNGCGFAGATTTYNVDGVEYKIRGAWSSGSTHYNNVTHRHYTECTVLESGQLGGWGGMNIPVSNLIKMIEDQKLPYKLVMGLGVSLNTIEVVHNDDVERFISQAGMWNPESYSRTGTRWSSQYSDIEGPSKYRTRYIKDDIENAQVLN